jgi:hypothetical protein
VIAKALTITKPKARYAVAKDSFVSSTLPSLLPRRLVDRMLGRRTGLLPKEP